MNCKKCDARGSCTTPLECCWSLTHGFAFCEVRLLQVIELKWKGNLMSVKDIIDEIDELRIFLRNDDFLCQLFLDDKIKKLQKHRKIFNDDKLVRTLIFLHKLVL